MKEDNQAVIKALNMYGRVPETWELLEEIERLNKKIEQYENPEDMTLMFMWCDEKAKDEIERLNNIINELEEELERESNMKEEDTGLEHNTFIDIRNTLKNVLKRLQELKGSDNDK